MSFVLDEYPYHADIVSTTPRRVVGRVYIPDRPGPLPVCDDQGRLIFTVERLKNAIPEFEKYHSAHDPSWQAVYTNKAHQGLPLLFMKRTLYGEFRVDQPHNVSWI